jgi:hypothetical protein
MNGMTRYYVSRALISASLGGILAITGLEWWLAVIIGATIFAIFLWAPRSGRYAIHAKRGVTALQRDERTQMINDRAARNAFVITTFLIAALAVYFGSIDPGSVPVNALSFVLVVSALTYFASDLWLRRT